MTREPSAAPIIWRWEGVMFEFVNPLAQDDAGTLKTNALSCGLKVQARVQTADLSGDAPPRSVLLTGDIESAQEAALVQRLRSALRSPVLLVSQHGRTIF